MTLQDFYLSLPTVEQYPVQIPGYIDAFKLVPNIRVIPDQDFISELPLNLKLDYFFLMSYPCYYIPIVYRRAHYGFLLKDNKKRVLKVSSGVQAFNLDAVDSKYKFVFLVEGLKDAFWFLMKGYPVMAYLTSFVSEDILKFIASSGKIPVLVHDSDLAGKRGRIKFLKACSFMRIPCQTFSLRFNKDAGEWFENPGLVGSQLESFVQRIS